jgi:hypothetical protein
MIFYCIFIITHYLFFLISTYFILQKFNKLKKQTIKYLNGLYILFSG